MRGTCLFSTMIDAFYVCRTVTLDFRRLPNIVLHRHKCVYSGHVLRHTSLDVLHFQSNEIFQLIKHIKVLFYIKFNCVKMKHKI